MSSTREQITASLFNPKHAVNGDLVIHLKVQEEVPLAPGQPRPHSGQQQYYLEFKTSKTCPAAFFLHSRTFVPLLSYTIAVLDRLKQCLKTRCCTSVRNILISRDVYKNRCLRTPKIIVLQQARNKAEALKEDDLRYQRGGGRNERMLKANFPT